MLPEAPVFLTFYTILPVGLLVSAALLSRLPRTRPYWRYFVLVHTLLAYNSFLWADLALDVSGWSPTKKDYNTMWQARAGTFHQHFPMSTYFPVSTSP